MPIFHAIRQSEVSNLDLSVFIQKNIFRLQVTVRNLSVMAILQARHKLLEVHACFRFTHFATVSNEIKEFTARNVLHDDMDLALLNYGLIDTDEMRMFESLKEPNFPCHLLLQRLL